MAALVVTVQTPGAPARDLVFGSSPVRLGRGVENDICLPFPFVSDRHGEVRFDETSAYYQDLGSTNGTLVGGKRVDSHKPISIVKRLVIVIGSLTLSFRLQDVEVPRSAISPPAPAGIPAENVPTAPAIASAPDPASPPSPAELRSLPTLFPGSARPEPTDPGAGSRYAPPNLFPESSRRDAEPDRSLHRSRLAPPTLFPLGAPTVQPDPDRAGGMSSQAAGEIHARTPAPPQWSGAHPVSSPDPSPSILAGNVEKPSPAPATSPPRPSRAPTPSPPASISGSGSSGVAAAGVTDSEQVKRLQKLTRLLCDELVRLRKTYEAFGRETGIRPFPLSEATRLHDLQDGEQLARYLTSSVLSDARMDELKRLFADMASHQLALIGAMLEGARGALHAVAPQNVSASKSRLAIFEDRRWNENLERFTAFVEDDERLLAAVFGPEFAAAYAAARGT